MSAKATVTVRRSSPPARRRGMPHSRQNLARSGLISPQAAQRTSMAHRPSSQSAEHRGRGVLRPTSTLVWGRFSPVECAGRHGLAAARSLKNMDVRTPQRAILALLVMLALLPAASALAADTGTAGPAFTGATAPTGEKPQSKQWFNDGSWWAVMYRPSAGSYQIFRDVAGTWTPTGTDVDTRESTYADAQWDGAHLNIVSAGMGVTQGVRYMRFSYDPATQAYTRDFAPVTLTSFGVEAAVLDRDGAGTLWITYTHDQQVWVAHSTTDDASWSDPFVLPGSATVTTDDISAIVRYPGHIGVLYSNQDPAVWAFTWASHADGAADTDWQLSTALQGAELSDDHINLKALDNDPAGQVFAAVKTSLNAGSDPQIKL